MPSFLPPCHARLSIINMPACTGQEHHTHNHSDSRAHFVAYTYEYSSYYDENIFILMKYFSSFYINISFRNKNKTSFNVCMSDINSSLNMLSQKYNLNFQYGFSATIYFGWGHLMLIILVLLFLIMLSNMMQYYCYINL